MHVRGFRLITVHGRNSCMDVKTAVNGSWKGNGLLMLGNGVCVQSCTSE